MSRSDRLLAQPRSPRLLDAAAQLTQTNSTMTVRANPSCPRQQHSLVQDLFSKRGRETTMDLGTGIALLVAFLAVVVLIIRGQSPIIMLLLLAVLWAAIAGIGIDEIQKKVIQTGGVQYASAVIIIVFGAWFAQVLIQTGIA